MADTSGATPSKLDEALTKIDALLGAAPVEKAFDKAAFETYVAEQLEASIAETTAGSVEIAQKRLVALKAVVATAKASWDSGATTVTLLQTTDPWYLAPNTSRAKVADVPSALPKAGDSNVQTTGDVLLVEKRATATGGMELVPTDLFRTLYAIAKADETARAPIAKSEEGRTLIAKAGEALAILAKIAAVFNVSLESPADLLNCELRWQVSDMISALQSAAKVEQVMTQMGAGLGIAKDAATPAPAAPGAPVAKSAAAALGEVAWPLDLASAELDEASGVLKDSRGPRGKKHRGWDESDKDETPPASKW
jgi:hypothetical protein